MRKDGQKRIPAGFSVYMAVSQTADTGSPPNWVRETPLILKTMQADNSP
jgi:hypothetical protein